MVLVIQWYRTLPLALPFFSIQRFELFNNINKFDISFTQLGTKEQVNILLYGYPQNISNTLNQDIIKFVINFLKKSGYFDKPLISFNKWFYILLLFFLPTCLLYVIVYLLIIVSLLLITGYKLTHFF